MPRVTYGVHICSINYLWCTFQIEEHSRALPNLGHDFGGSISSLDSAAPLSDTKQEKWKQGARKTLLQWVTNALPKYVL